MTGKLQEMRDAGYFAHQPVCTTACTVYTLLCSGFAQRLGTANILICTQGSRVINCEIQLVLACQIWSSLCYNAFRLGMQDFSCPLEPSFLQKHG